MTDYSNDVEIDHTGKLVYVRSIKPGARITVPSHMLSKAITDLSKSHILRTPVDGATWLNLFRK